MIVFFNSFLFLTVLIKRIEKTKNRVKSDLEVTIKAIDSKHMEIFSAIESADSKRKELESVAKEVGSAVQRVGLKNRENDLLSQEIRTIRALDELDFFPLMITRQSFLTALQKYSLVIIRSCLTSTFLNF